MEVVAPVWEDVWSRLVPTMPAGSACVSEVVVEAFEETRPSAAEQHLAGVFDPDDRSIRIEAGWAREPEGESVGHELPWILAHELCHAAAMSLPWRRIHPWEPTPEVVGYAREEDFARACELGPAALDLMLAVGACGDEETVAMAQALLGTVYPGWEHVRYRVIEDGFWRGRPGPRIPAARKGGARPTRRYREPERGEGVVDRVDRGGEGASMLGVGGDWRPPTSVAKGWSDRRPLSVWPERPREQVEVSDGSHYTMFTLPTRRGTFAVVARGHEGAPDVVSARCFNHMEVRDGHSADGPRYPGLTHVEGWSGYATTTQWVGEDFEQIVRFTVIPEEWDAAMAEARGGR